MKKLIFISLLFSILSLSVSAQKPTKAEKAAQLEQEFQQTRQLIESNGNFRRWELLGKPEQQQSGTNFLFRDRQSG